MMSIDEEPVYYTTFSGWQETLYPLLEKSGLAELIEQYEQVLLKPNLVSVDPPPITTPVGIIEAAVSFIRKHYPAKKIIIGEGTGTPDYSTFKPFEELGYQNLVDKYDVELIDLNDAPLVELHNADCRRWPSFYLPQICLDSFLISVPVLKAHSLADVTLSMKNLIGLAPPEHYNAGSWNKSAFHAQVHEAIFDMNRYRTPDFTILDATIGMAEAHLWGAECDPHVNLIAVSRDPVASDAFGAKLLGLNWEYIGHIKMADGVLGKANQPFIKL